jgi:hypothetical protein
MPDLDQIKQGEQGCGTGATTTEGPVLHPEQTPGPGCRAYLLRHGGTVIVLPAGGNRRTRAQDIEVTLEPCALPVVASHGRNLDNPLGNRRPSQNARRNCGLSGRRFRGVTLPRTAHRARGGTRRLAHGRPLRSCSIANWQIIQLPPPY